MFVKFNLPRPFQYTILLTLCFIIILTTGIILKDYILNSIIISETQKDNNGIRLETRPYNAGNFKSFRWDNSSLNLSVKYSDSITDGYTILYIESSGKYHFKADADDSCEIRIGGKVLINQDQSRPQASNVSIASIELKKGYHLLHVKLGNGPGPGRLDISYSNDKNSSFSPIDNRAIHKNNLSNIEVWATIHYLLESCGLSLIKTINHQLS
jgi:hypothetical protein